MKATPSTQTPAQRTPAMRRSGSSQVQPQRVTRQPDRRSSRYAAQSGNATQPPQAPQNYPRVPPNIPPQITAQTVQRAQAHMPSDSELVEAEIAGEKVKASLKTIDYLKRFESFLNKTPSEKLQVLNERFFRKIPRDNSVLKTNRGKDVKCPV